MTALRNIKSLQRYILFFAAAKLMAGLSLFTKTQLPATGAIRGHRIWEDDDFSNKLKSVGVVTRFSVPAKFSYPVVHSKSYDGADSLVIQYVRAAENGNIGLLANCQTAGLSFHCLSLGDEVIVAFKEKSPKVFVVSNIEQFRATDPSDFSKPFMDEQGKIISADALFKKAYNRNGLTFQKCLFGNGSWTWGILIVQAREKTFDA
jgi:hypothetical protein